jgi:dUTP pyrophosphatase
MSKKQQAGAQPATEQQDQATPDTLALQVRVKRLTETAKLPVYATAGAECFDLHADIAHLGRVPANGAAEFETGLAFEIPDGHCMLAFSRSGHGFKHGVRLSNCVGVIDADYRGAVKVKLANDSQRDMHVFPGDRIAKAMILPIQAVEFVEVAELGETERGEGGMGSTGA